MPCTFTYVSGQDDGLMFPIRLECVNNGTPDATTAPGDCDIDHGELQVSLICLVVPCSVDLGLGDLTPKYAMTIGLLFNVPLLIRRDVN